MAGPAASQADLGSGNAEPGFVRSVDDAVHRFYAAVVAHLEESSSQRYGPTG